MRPVIFPRNGPRGMTLEEVRTLLPNVGDVRQETLTTQDKIDAPHPQECVVVEVNRANLWYRVRFAGGFHECYKVPRVKFIPTGGLPW